MSSFSGKSYCHSQAILIQNYPIKYLPTLATEVYAKSLHNTVFGFYNCYIFSCVGCKNQPCSSISKQSSFVKPIHVNPDGTKPEYVSSKYKTPQLCSKRIGKFDGFCFCINYPNHQCFYLHGVSFIFINVTIYSDREKFTFLIKYLKNRLIVRIHQPLILLKNVTNVEIL